MKVKKLFKDSGMPNHCAVQLCDGSYARFLMGPFRKISESDLVKIPYYRALGVKGKEADPYMYKVYGLEKQ